MVEKMFLFLLPEFSCCKRQSKQINTNVICSMGILYEKLLNCKFSLYIYVTAILGPISICLLLKDM